MTTTHWLTYQEPINDNWVQATWIIERDDADNTIRHGKLAMEALTVWDGTEHVMDDGTLWVSALDHKHRKQVEAAFQAHEASV